MKSIHESVPQLIIPIVLHRLPGRLRAHLPVLRHVPHDSQEVLRMIEEVLTGPAGIQAAQICQTTGNVLLVYDVNAASEADVLSYLHRIAHLALKNWPLLARLSSRELVLRKERWVSLARSAAREHRSSGQLVEVTNDDLA